MKFALRYMLCLLLTIAPCAYAADVKISNLPAASTPLAGTEVVPGVQSGTTKKITTLSIASLGLPRTLTADTTLTFAGYDLTFGDSTVDAPSGLYAPGPLLVMSDADTTAGLFSSRGTGSDISEAGVQAYSYASNEFAKLTFTRWFASAPYQYNEISVNGGSGSLSVNLQSDSFGNSAYLRLNMAPATPLWHSTGSWQFEDYANSRTDFSGSTPANFLYTDSSGNLKTGPLNSATTRGALGFLRGSTGSISGAVTLNTCDTGTATVTGATTSMVAAASPVTYPGDSVYWKAYVSANDTVTVKVCGLAVVTPTASVFNVSVIP